MTVQGREDWRLYWRLVREGRHHWPQIGALFFLSLLATPIALLMPLPLKIVIDSVIRGEALPGMLDVVIPQQLHHSTESMLLVAVVLVLVIALCEHLQKLAVSVFGAYTGERIALDFRAKLFRHVQRLSLSYHDSKGASDSTYRIHWDAAAIQWISIYGVTPFIGALFTLGGMLYVTARLDWQLAVAALTITPFVAVITSWARRRVRGGWSTSKMHESRAIAVVQEVLGGLRLVRAFGQEEREQARFVSCSSESMRARVRVALTEGMFELLTGLTIAAGTAAVLLLGVRHVQAGMLSLGALVLVMTYLARLYLPFQEISKSITLMQAALASAERAFALLDVRADVVEKPNARPVTRARGAVTFRHVSFAYEDRGDCVLRDVSLEVAPGTRLGISGTTGAGKTTLVNLLLRFYDPTSGQILLDGVDLRDYKLADLRNQFSIVLQEPILFSTSISENIAYARPYASEPDIIEAARAANAHGFISRLPDGYRTVVGEQGMRLSGGQRQRIALARAFLKDTPILILDEPTSSVDIKTENMIMEAMERLMRGRTTFMIAHRLSTLSICDRRITMKQGRSLAWSAPSL